MYVGNTTVEGIDGGLHPVVDAQHLHEVKLDACMLQPTLRNQLGASALRFLRKGQPVEDQVVVEILAEAIK